MYLNKLEKDFDLQVRYLYFEIEFNFICTAKFLTFLDDNRIDFICTAKFLTFLDDSRIDFICTANFLTFSDDGGIW